MSRKILKAAFHALRLSVSPHVEVSHALSFHDYLSKRLSLFYSSFLFCVLPDTVAFVYARLRVPIASPALIQLERDRICLPTVTTVVRMDVAILVNTGLHGLPSLVLSLSIVRVGEPAEAGAAPRLSNFRIASHLLVLLCTRAFRERALRSVSIHEW